HVVAPRLALEHRALAEPRARGEAGETRRLAAARHRPHPRQARDDAGPVVEGVAAHENMFVRTKGFLHDAGAGDLDLLLVEFARPCRDALEIIGSNHECIDRRAPWGSA